MLTECIVRRLSGSITFEDSPDWSGNTTHAATKWHKWLANFETHTIAIPRRQIEEYAYQPGLPDTRDSERYGIAMFHQLHCLVRNPLLLLTSFVSLVFFIFGYEGIELRHGVCVCSVGHHP